MSAVPNPMPFVKMHGLGNDFILLDARTLDDLPLYGPTIRALANWHTGIGCDQLVLLEPSASALAKMRIFNRDGGEVEACGNAARAVAMYLGKIGQLETTGGPIAITPDTDGASVDMGTPNFAWDAIPLAYPMDTMELPVSWAEGDLVLERPIAVNVGNPHVVFFVPDIAAVPLERIGPTIENDPLFPKRINVNIAAIGSRDAIALRVWERGAGLTRACGTGACATAIAAMRRGLVDRSVTVALPGGDLRIEWTADERIIMSGPAATSFTGTFRWQDYA